MDKPLDKRMKNTLAFVRDHLEPHTKILDLGVENPMGKLLRDNGFQVANTRGEDLDVEFEKYAAPEYDCVTAFEIFEHLMAPYNILKTIRSKHLVASVPLRLWFSTAYWNKNDPWDRHYHEFEPRQFDMLLERTGWQILDSEKWTSYAPGTLGFRPLLRRITNRYYIVYCTRASISSDRIGE